MATGADHFLPRQLNSWPLQFRRSLCIALLLMLQCSAIAAAAGRAGYAYGERFVRSGEESLDGPAHAPAVAAPIDPAQLQAFSARLEELENQGGPYSPELSETLADLAGQMEAQGNYNAALRLYRRALHLVRVNEGLYSPRQVSLVRAEINLYRRLGDVKSLDQRYDYYFRLFGSGQPPHTEIRVRAALAYLRWQREAIRQGLAQGAMPRMLDTIALNDELLEAVASEETGSPWHIELVLSQLNNLYILQQYFEPDETEEWRRSRSPFSAFDEPGIQDINYTRIQALRRRAMSAGAAMLSQTIADLGDSAPEADRVRLHLALADWYQWYGLAPSAAEHYSAVRAVLLQAGDESRLQEVLGEPVELPANGVFRRVSAAASGGQGTSLQVRMDVSANGRGRNVELLEAPPGAEARGSRLVRALRSVRFRPRWLNGHPEDTLGVERAYLDLR